MIGFIQQGIIRTRKNGTGKYDRSHLVNSSSEINMLVNSLQNCLGIQYTTLLIDFHCHTQGYNAVSRSTFNLAFRILLPKVTKI